MTTDVYPDDLMTKPFSVRLKETAIDGVLLGVKILIVLTTILAGAGWVVGDYVTVRGNALKGSQAYEFINQQLQAQQKAQDPKATPPK